MTVTMAKKQFSVIKSSSDTQRNWSNYFPLSGVTVYLKYLIEKNLSYIKVGKTLGGDMQDESVQIFSPTTQGTIEAVAYFNEISHNQDIVQICITLVFFPFSANLLFFIA